jgi:hypothetical protein
MVAAALTLEGGFAAVDVALGPLLHLLDVVARVVHVLLAECADYKLGLHKSSGLKANDCTKPQFLFQKQNGPPMRAVREFFYCSTTLGNTALARA